MHRLFENLKDETNKPLEATVTGSIPEWLNGSLYRTGPGIFEVGNTSYDHWFDGLAVIHRFHTAGGKAYYQNKHLNGEDYKTNIAANRIALTSFGTVAYPDPCKSVLQRFFSWWAPDGKGDNANVSMFPVGDALIATTESHKLVHIDKETLDVKGNINLEETASIFMATAHPHIEPDGTLHNLGATRQGGYSYALFKMVPAKGKKAVQNGGVDPPTEPHSLVESAETVMKLTPQWRFHPSYYHSFGLTDNYYVFVEQPLVINVFKLMLYKLLQWPMVGAIEWWKDYPTKLHIIDRHTGKKVHEDVTYQADTFMCLHTVNAYEEDGQIVVDMCCYDSNAGEFFKNTYLEQFQRPKEPGQKHNSLDWSNVQRFVLPVDLDKKDAGENLVTIKFTSAQATLKTQGGKRVVKCTSQKIAHGVEMPQINYKSYNSKKYTYMYGIGPDELNGTKYIKKVNLETMEVLKWAEDQCVPSEPIFVPSPDSKDEDDGVLMSLVLTTHEKRFAFLLILNAKDMSEMVRATVDVQVPTAIHGTFIHHT